MTPTQLPTRVVPRDSLALTSALVGLLICAAWMTGCGGGGATAPVTTVDSTPTPVPAPSPTPTPTVTGLTAGVVTGKGSTIVNGVRFDDSGSKSAIRIVGDDNATTDATGSALFGEAVKPGMEVEIEHGVITCSVATSTDKSSPAALAQCAAAGVTPESVATSMVFGNNSLQAPIQNYLAGDPAASPPLPTRFTLLGQTVRTTPNTAVDLGVPAVAGLADGVLVEVHGMRDNAGVTLASRIQVKKSGVYRLRGTLDLTAQTPTIGGQAVALTPAQRQQLADDKAHGLMVGARLAAGSTTSAPFEVDFVKLSQRPLGAQQANMAAALEGVIAAVDSTVAGEVSFLIRGSKVKARAADGPVLTGLAGLAALVNGLHLEVAGTVDATGALLARSITVRNDATGLGGEFHGRIVKPNPDPAAAVSTPFVNTYNVEANGRRTFQIWSSALINGKLVTTLRETIEVNDKTRFTANQGANFSESILASLGPSGLVIVFGTRSADGTYIIADKVKRDVSTE